MEAFKRSYSTSADHVSISMSFEYRYIKVLQRYLFVVTFSNPASMVEEFVQQMNDVVLAVLDKHASLLI